MRQESHPSPQPGFTICWTARSNRSQRVWRGRGGSEDPPRPTYLRLPRVFDALRTRELSQLVFRRTGHLAIGLHRLPRLYQRLRIGHGDPILENPWRDEPDSLAYGHLVAVRREPLDVGVVTQGHGVDDERVAFPVTGGISGIG